MITDKNRVFDGWLTLEGGVDAGREPDTIEVNQARSALNMTFRGGSATTRPGFRKIDETFPLRHYDPGTGLTWKTKQLWCYNQTILLPPFGEEDRRIEGEYKAQLVPLTTFPPPLPPPDEIAFWFTNQSSEDIYRNGKLQCALAYSPHNGEDCIMALIGGRLFKIIPGVTAARVSEVLIHGKGRNLRNMDRFPLAYMCQADKWLIAQDGISPPIIYDGAKARRSNTTGTVDETEVPVGTIMAYGMGRLVVVVNDRDIAFGDLHGSHDLPDPADSLVLFTERNFLAEGFDAAIPFTQGVVTGMAFTPQLDSSTGTGQLMAFAERGSTSFFLSLDRSLWKTSLFQVLSLLTTGLRGHRSISVVNEDLWFRSDDGVRSYRQARSEPSGWAHIPLSTPVRQFLENDADFLLKYASSMYFDNRILVTTSPMWNQGRPIHTGVVVVDFDVLSSFGGTATQPQTSKPAWEGQWKNTQFFPSQILTGTFNGITRAFVFGLDSLNHNQLYELSVDDKDDFDGERINWELVSRTFDFQKLSQQSTPFTENELYDADLWLREIVE